MRVYGADICIDCRNFKAIQQARGFEVRYIDITASTANLKEYLVIRDIDPIYDMIRARNEIGIPLYVNDDGTKTFDINEALAWIGEPPVREEEIVEHRPECGVKGC